MSSFDFALAILGFGIGLLGLTQCIVSKEIIFPFLTVVTFLGCAIMVYFGLEDLKEVKP